MSDFLERARAEGEASEARAQQEAHAADRRHREQEALRAEAGTILAQFAAGLIRAGVAPQRLSSKVGSYESLASRLFKHSMGTGWLVGTFHGQGRRRLLEDRTPWVSHLVVARTSGEFDLFEADNDLGDGKVLRSRRSATTLDVLRALDSKFSGLSRDGDGRLTYLTSYDGFESTQLLEDVLLARIRRARG